MKQHQHNVRKYAHDDFKQHQTCKFSLSFGGRGVAPFVLRSFGCLAGPLQFSSVASRGGACNCYHLQDAVVVCLCGGAPTGLCNSVFGIALSRNAATRNKLDKVDSTLLPVKPQTQAQHPEDSKTVKSKSSTCVLQFLQRKYNAYVLYVGYPCRASTF